MTDRILCSLAALLLFAGCFKSTSYDTGTCCGHVQTENQGPSRASGGVPPPMPFAADTSGWTVALPMTTRSKACSPRAASRAGRMDDPWPSRRLQSPLLADFPNSVDAGSPCTPTAPLAAGRGRRSTLPALCLHRQAALPPHTMSKTSPHPTALAAPSRCSSSPAFLVRCASVMRPTGGY